MGRSRSRSRSPRRESPRRERKRSRSPREKRRMWDAPAPPSALPPAPVAPVGPDPHFLAQQQALAQLQQQQLQRQLLAQQLMMQQGAMQAPATDRKQREVYIGNLLIGVVTGDMLRELFNAVLAPLVADPVTNPPVVAAKMDAQGRYCFVELRTVELCDAAMQLDKLELCSRPINVGRPKGFVDVRSPQQTAQSLAAAQQFAMSLAAGTSNIVLMENMLKCGPLRNEKERIELIEDVREECGKFGQVLGVAVPPPPAFLGDNEACRVFVKFGMIDEARKCKDANDGRLFDANKISCSYVTEFDFARALNNEWVDKGNQGPKAASSAAVPGMSYA